MKKILTLLILLVIMVGCSKNKKTVCSWDQGDGFSQEVTLTSKENIVKYRKTIEKTPYSFFLGSYGYTKDELKSINELYAEKMSKIEGVEYEFELDGEILVETTIIDFTKANFDELKESNLVSMFDDEHLNIDKEIAAYTVRGSSCK